MFRTLVVLFISAAVGAALGSLQLSLATSAKERFFLEDAPVLASTVNAERTSTSSDTSSLTQPATAPTDPKGDDSVSAQQPDSASSTSKAPKIELPEGTSFQFGTMKHGTEMSHDFPIRNVGDAPLIIEKTGSTCKCTVGNLDKDVLLPGESQMIHLTWRGVSVSPSFGQSATFKTNCLEFPELKLEIKGAVIDSFVFRPTEISLSEFSATVGTMREFSVFCYGEGVDVEQMNWSNPDTAQYFKMEKTEFDPSQDEDHAKALKAYRVSLEVLPGLPVGRVSGSVLLQTNQGSEVDKLSLDVNGRAVSNVTILGGSLYNSERSVLQLDKISSEKGFSTSLWLVLRGDLQETAQVSIDQQVALDTLKVSLQEKKKEGSRTLIPIKFEVPSGAPEAYYPGTGKGAFVVVTVRVSSSETVELPIHVKLVVTK